MQHPIGIMIVFGLKTTKDVPRILSVKFPQKIHVWGLMSHQALSELHIIPQGRTGNSLYYRDEILAKTCRDAHRRNVGGGNLKAATPGF